MGGADHTGIQPAIDAARDGDRVLVRAGEYVIDPTGAGVGLDCLNKKITVKSEDGPEETIIRGAVNFNANYTADTVLAGFTITGDDVYCRQSSSPTLRDLVFDGNGIWLERSSPAISNCTFTNSRLGSGQVAGALLCGVLSNPLVTNCTFKANNGRGLGGAVGVTLFAAPTFVNCIFTENDSSRSRGGAIVVRDRATPTFINCLITSNHSNSDGGGVHIQGSSGPVFMNCTIADNAAGLSEGDASGSGVNVTESSTPIFTNCIIAGNVGGAQVEVDAGSSVLVTYTLTDDDAPLPGVGNRNDVPLFFAADDYHLQPGSPAIDAGVLDGAPETDIEGNRRPCGGGVDMGAYESGDCSRAAFLRGDCNGDGFVEGQVTDAIFLLNFNFTAGAGAAVFLGLRRRRRWAGRWRGHRRRLLAQFQLPGWVSAGGAFSRLW